MPGLSWAAASCFVFLMVNVFLKIQIKHHKQNNKIHRPSRLSNGYPISGMKKSKPMQKLRLRL